MAHIWAKTELFFRGNCEPDGSALAYLVVLVVVAVVG